MVEDHKKVIVNNSFEIPWKKFYVKNTNKPDLSLEKLDDLYSKELISSKADSLDPYYQHLKTNSHSINAYYYSVIDSSSFYSLVYYTRGEYEQSFDLISYSKKHKILDMHRLTHFAGDGGYVNYSETQFLSDSTLSKTKIEAEYIKYDSISGESKERILKQRNLKLTLRKSGAIVVDSIL